MRGQGAHPEVKAFPTEREPSPAVLPDSAFPSRKPILISSRTFNNALPPALTPRGCMVEHVNTVHSLPFRIRNNTHHPREWSSFDSWDSL